jgi:hypothetical protein
MTLLTIFTAPKAFTDPHINTIQRNAIQSWMQLAPEAEILLIGDEDGMREIAQELKVRQISNVERNDQGTPLVSSIFKLARQESHSPLMLYVNADILLLPDILEAARNISVQVQQFLVIGQRWDLSVPHPISFEVGWDTKLRQDAQSRGKLHLPAGSDYFLFPRHQFNNLPNFAIGRAGWDNWMIYYARKQGWVVIDGTPSILVIHQEHDYAHLPGGKPHYTLNESHANENLAGGSANLYMVLDSQKQYRDGTVCSPKFSLVRTLRWGEIYFTPPDGTRQGWRWSVARKLRRMRRRITGSLAS